MARIRLLLWKQVSEDMIADADNNFYVFSASGNVFKVITKELKAKYIGKIAGIPDNYSVNGSAVNAQGKVIIASAKGAALYEVDLETLQARELPGRKVCISMILQANIL